jgi:phosphoserine phosphatase RsbX
VAELRRPLEWGTAIRARSGEFATGDLGLVARNASGTLVAAVDGVGHGAEAAKAARVGADVLSAHPSDDLFALVVRCHEALRSTRGVAMSIAYFPEELGVMTWLGIGNVEGRVFGSDGGVPRAKSVLRLAGGVLGHELPTVTRETLELQPGDLVVFATDGIGPSFADSLPAGAPQEIADRIVNEHWKPTDDGLALVVRYLG